MVVVELDGAVQRERLVRGRAKGQGEPQYGDAARERADISRHYCSSGL
jgi:hypothetical protein